MPIRQTGAVVPLQLPLLLSPEHHRPPSAGFASQTGALQVQTIRGDRCQRFFCYTSLFYFDERQLTTTATATARVVPALRPCGKYHMALALCACISIVYYLSPVSGSAVC
jgi:hypothetical protein